MAYNIFLRAFDNMSEMRITHKMSRKIMFYIYHKRGYHRKSFLKN